MCRPFQKLSTTGFVPLLIISAGGICSPLYSQDTHSWENQTTFGYGGLGCWAGYLLGSELLAEAELEGATGPSILATPLRGCVAGGYVGRSTGREADTLLADGEELPKGLRRGIQLGTVLAGATLASGISLIHASQQEGRKTEIVAAYSLVGAVIGAAVQIAINDRLQPAQGPLPFRVGRTPDGGVSLAFSYSH